MHFTEYDTRVAAYAVIVDADQRVLLTWYNGEGRHEPGWSLPGGGVEFEETLVEGLEREVHEETGYRVVVGEPFVTQAWGHRDGTSQSDKPFKADKVVFEATITGGELGTVEVGGSTDYAAWVPLDELATGVPRADIVDVGVAAWLARHRDA